MKQKMRLGIIGGGLMGREAASAFGRWFVLEDFPVDVNSSRISSKPIQPTMRAFIKKLWKSANAFPFSCAAAGIDGDCS